MGRVPERHLFVLGAGFSCARGFPIGAELLPRVRQRVQQAQEADITETCQLLQDALDAVDPAGERSFDEVARACVQDHPGALRVLRLGLRSLFWEIFRASQTSKAYEAFARWASRGAGVVSFNWDLIVEQAASDAAIPWSYDPHASSTGFRLVKVHGSLNWVHAAELRPVHSDLYSELYPGVFCLTKLPLADPDPRGILEATPMVLPGDEEVLQAIWSAADRLVTEADRIVFIGYSAPDYDREAVQWIRGIGSAKAVEIVDPNVATVQRLAGLLCRTPEVQLVDFERCSYAVDPA